MDSHETGLRFASACGRLAGCVEAILSEHRGGMTLPPATARRLTEAIERYHAAEHAHLEALLVPVVNAPRAVPA